MNKFTAIVADSRIWNYDDLLKFLVDHQGTDIVINTRSEGCCAHSIGLYKLLDLFKFKSVTLETANIVEAHDRYTISANTNVCFRFFNVPRVDYSQYHQWDQTYKFGAWYNRAIWHRIGLAGHLNRYHKNSTLLNFRYDPADQDRRSEFEIQRLFEIDPESAADFLANINGFPQQQENLDGYTIGATTKRHTDQLAEFYKSFLIDIVAETFTSGRTFFVTEKTLRPILLKKPFIVMGPKCFLIHLRQMGFRTFNDYWDEDYDGYDPENKYLKILKLIQYLGQLPINELVKQYEDMQDILKHNHNILINRLYNQNISYVE